MTPDKALAEVATSLRQARAECKELRALVRRLRKDKRHQLAIIRTLTLARKS